jgi:hypothetical protein
VLGQVAHRGFASPMISTTDEVRMLLALIWFDVRPRRQA